MWHAIPGRYNKGQTVSIIGRGGLGILGTQFAKARGYRVIAIGRHEVGLELASGVPSRPPPFPDIVLKLDDPETVQKISDFTDVIGLKATIVCTSDDTANDWASQRLKPRGILVAAGFPEHGLKFNPMNLILREIFVKGTVHGSMDETREMTGFVVQHGICSHSTLLTMEEAENIAAKSEAHAFMGRPVFKNICLRMLALDNRAVPSLSNIQFSISTAIFLNHWSGGAFKSLVLLLRSFLTPAANPSEEYQHGVSHRPYSMYIEHSVSCPNSKAHIP
ncbi:alcohol dehydrogenase 5 [Fusarium coicis]|nr:alcohol dehydrogenase 5 [Fusarium coicis]